MGCMISALSRVAISIFWFAVLIKVADGSEETKSVPFNYIKLVVEWYPSSCRHYRVQCNEPIWVLHGLWGFVKNKRLRNVEGYENYRFDSKAILNNETLHAQLKHKWKHCNPTVTNLEQWAHEWNKHGKYFKNVAGDQTAYFERSIQLFDGLNIEQLSSELNIRDDKPIAIIEISNALKNIYGIDAILVCESMSNNEDMFSQIRFCFNNDLTIFSCSENEKTLVQNCTQSTVRFPLSSEGEKIVEKDVTLEEGEEIENRIMYLNAKLKQNLESKKRDYRSFRRQKARRRRGKGGLRSLDSTRQSSTGSQQEEMGDESDSDIEMSEEERSTNFGEPSTSRHRRSSRYTSQASRQRSRSRSGRRRSRSNQRSESRPHRRQELESRSQRREGSRSDHTYRGESSRRRDRSHSRSRKSSSSYLRSRSRSGSRRKQRK